MYPCHVESRARTHISHPNVPSPAHAAGSSIDQSTGQVVSTGTSQQDQIRATLLARAKIKFSGQSRAVVGAHIDSDATKAGRGARLPSPRTVALSLDSTLTRLTYVVGLIVCLCACARRKLVTEGGAQAR